MVDPDVGGGLDVDEIHPFGRVLHGEVADDDIVGLLDAETTVSEARAGTDTKDGGVAVNVHDIAAGKLAVDMDDAAIGESRGELRARGDGDRVTRASSGLGSVPNELINFGCTAATRRNHRTSRLGSLGDRTSSGQEGRDKRNKGGSHHGDNRHSLNDRQIKNVSVVYKECS